jgi:hypothetical protein
MASRTHPDQLRSFIEVIVSGDSEKAIGLLAASPELARESTACGASRENAKDNFFVRIEHYLNEGDTALHMAAAANHSRVAEELIAKRADVRARNRRGAEPLTMQLTLGRTRLCGARLIKRRSLPCLFGLALIQTLVTRAVSPHCTAPCAIAVRLR